MLVLRKSLIDNILRKVLKRLHYPLEVMLTCIRWYVANPLSLRHIEEMMQERGVFVDHATVHRWAIRVCCRYWRPYSVVASTPWVEAGAWTKPISRSQACGNICTAPSTETATRWIFCSAPNVIWLRPGDFGGRAINLHDEPEKITIDKNGANTEAINSIKSDACVDILLRQNKYLNNIVEQDHRAIKRTTRPMLGFKSFLSAKIIIAGIEIMRMIRKGQVDCPGGQPVSAATQFYSLAD